MGRRFKVDDCRVWMRLHFWAAREVGLFDNPAFEDYYTRYIGHFMSVYERRAPPFAREAARWSADSRNVLAYLADPRAAMADVIDVGFEQAIQTLPPAERLYAGNNGGQVPWPYDIPMDIPAASDEASTQDPDN